MSLLRVITWMRANDMLNPTLHDNTEITAWALMVLGNAMLATTALLAGMLGVLAPYGWVQDRNTGWKFSKLPKINSKLGWYIMELPALAAAIYAVSLTGIEGCAQRPLHLQLAVIFYIAHYCNRGIVFPAQRGRSDKFEPCITFLLGAFFNSVNGYTLCRYVMHFGSGTEIDVATTWTWLGVGMFAFGVYVNTIADSRLMELSEQRHKIKASKGNNIMPIVPGLFFMFEYVTAANYLGELIEWIGFLMMTWPSPASACFVWMTFCNLAPRAHAKHNIYLREIPAYATLGRKALIPFLW